MLCWRHPENSPQAPGPSGAGFFGGCLLFPLHPRFLREQQVPPQEPPARLQQPWRLLPDLRPTPWQTHLGVGTAVANALGGRRTRSRWKEPEPRLGGRRHAWEVGTDSPASAALETHKQHPKRPPLNSRVFPGVRREGWDPGPHTFHPASPPVARSHAALRPPDSARPVFSLPPHPTPPFVRSSKDTSDPWQDISQEASRSAAAPIQFSPLPRPRRLGTLESPK